MALEHLGYCAIAPFRRDKKRDFASAGGEELVRSAVMQVLGTVGASEFTQGELPWRTEFGSLLHILRHKKNDVVLRELARVYVRDALRRWEPRIVVTGMDIQHLDPDGNQLSIRLRYQIIQRNVPGNKVLLGPLEQTVEV
jgi:phage baseplate assembly protein W